MVNGHPRTTFELNLPRCALLFDGHSIIEAEGLNWKLADNDLDLKQERITFDCEVIFFFNRICHNNHFLERKSFFSL